MVRTLKLLLIGLATAAPPALAEAPLVLPDVTVVGRAQPPLHASGAAIRVPVDPRSGNTLADLLATLPGVQVRRAGGLGSRSEAALRGSNGRQVRVLLDGLPLDAGGGEATSLSLISPLLLESVDVYKGRVPAELGRGLAGSINLRTRDKLPGGWLASAGLGRFGERQWHGAVQPADAWQLAGGSQRADNDFPFRNPFAAFDPDDPQRRAREPRRNAATRQDYLLLRHAGAMNLRAHWVDDRQNLPTRLNRPDTRTRLLTRRWSLALAPSETLSVSHSQTRERFLDPASQLGVGAQDNRDRSRRSRVQLRPELAALNLALDAEHGDFRSVNRLGGSRTDAARQSLAAALDVDLDAGLGPLLNASLRLHWTRDEQAGEAEVRWLVEPALGLTLPAGDCRFRANAGRRERLPTFFERYGDRGLFKGNPALEPESALYGDAAVDCRQGPALWQLAVFGQRLSDAISPSFNAQGIGGSVNTAHAVIYGSEADLDLVHGPWQLALAATGQHTEDRSNTRATRGKALPGRFEVQFHARLQRRWRGLTAHYAFLFESGQFHDSANLLAARPLRQHDIGLAGQFRHLGWSLNWLNLRDDNAQQFNGFPTPGRRWQFTLTYPHNP